MCAWLGKIFDLFFIGDVCLGGFVLRGVFGMDRFEGDVFDEGRMMENRNPIQDRE